MPEINVYEGLITQDILTVEETGLEKIFNISVFDSLLIIDVGTIHDIIIELGPIIQNISVVDRPTISRIENFSDFLRGYPFIEITESNIEAVEFENGIEQIIDRWGKCRKRFKITLPVSTKAEALPVRDFYIRNIGRKILFTSPIDNITYTCRFANGVYELERRHYNTYFAEIELVEVF